MTSIFDQYEQDCNKQDTICNTLNSTRLKPTSQDLVLYAELENATESDVPIFKIQKLKHSPSINSKISHFRVSNDKFVIGQVNGTLLFLSSDNDTKIRDLDISKFGGKLRHMFLDCVTGSHLLLTIITISTSPSAVTSELCYVHTPSLKLKHLSKMHNHVVTAVGFNFVGSSQHRTSPILLGTSKGLIFEMEIEAESDKLFASNAEQYCRQVFAIGRENNASSITGLEFHPFAESSNKYFIMCTTATRMYQFIGTVNNTQERPLLCQIFNNYLNTPEHFVEILNRNPGSKLQFHYDVSNTSQVIPKSYGWFLDEIGVFYGKVEDDVEENAKSISGSNFVIKYNKKPTPISFVLTEFHVILLCPNYITAISVIDKETICSELVDEGDGKLISIAKDVKTGNIWICSERSVFKCKVTKEDRYVWKMYLNNGEFELAKKYCSDNLFQLNCVLQKQAEQLFQDKRYEESAELYANTQCLFGEIALKFLQASEINALKLYLKKKLEQLKSTQSSQITMLTLWLIELYVSQLAGIDNKFKDEPELLNEIQLDFETFLSLPQVTACVKANKEIVYKLLASYGDMDNLLEIAKINRDYEKILRHFINEKDVYEALLILNDNSLSKDIFYKFIPEMISLAPKQMIDLLIKQPRNLNTNVVLQALIFPYENDTQALEVIRFLEFCVHSMHCREEEVHNYIVTLYVKYKPDRLMQYLTMQGQEISVVNYDVKYALRLCQEYNITEACVRLSSLLGLWESAVELALTVNIDLAKQTISQVPHENVELCKKLWLKIGKHVVNACNDIRHAMEFLQQCDLIKIEDILPFFPDFTTIDNFKDAICSSLQEYNKNIELLKEEMEEAISSAEAIRSEIHDFKNKYTVIQFTDTCCSCGIQLLLRPFYAFPCNHRFHVDCLMCELKPLLSGSIYSKLQSLQRQLANVSSTADNSSASSSSLAIKAQIKSEINSIIASECLFCGKPAIEQIDRTFIEENEFDRIKQDWE